MIRARKGGPFAWLVDQYIDAKVRSAFRAVWTRGPLPPVEGGLVLYVTHGNWWDGFIAHQLCRAAGLDGYCVMEEQNLARYRFLTRIGAFSIRRGDPSSALESLLYARSLLRKPRSAVVVFPQGELRPQEAGPLRLERGVEVLARTVGIRCQPVALRYAFFEHEYPDVLVELGPVHGAAPLARFAGELERVRERVQGARTLEGFQVAVRGRRSVAERWDAARAFALGRSGRLRGG